VQSTGGGQRGGARALGLEFQLEKVTHLNPIMTFGVMTTPARVVDGTVKRVGRVPKVDELKCVCGVVVRLGGVNLIYTAH
jgi:hypothetical protein